ncbi:MAG: hypothetical protein AAGF45_11835 [Pseudomonadota bacterium]
MRHLFVAAALLIASAAHAQSQSAPAELNFLELIDMEEGPGPLGTRRVSPVADREILDLSFIALDQAVPINLANLRIGPFDSQSEFSEICVEIASRDPLYTNSLQYQILSSSSGLERAPTNASKRPDLLQRTSRTATGVTARLAADCDAGEVRNYTIASMDADPTHLRLRMRFRSRLRAATLDAEDGTSINLPCRRGSTARHAGERAPPDSSIYDCTLPLTAPIRPGDYFLTIAYRDGSNTDGNWDSRVFIPHFTAAD